MLVIEARRRAFGLISNESINVPVFTSAEIDRGVCKFPRVACCEQDVCNEAIMVIFLWVTNATPAVPS